MRRRLLLLAVLAAAGSCKRQQAPRVESLGSTEVAVEGDEALGAMAPPWTETTRSRLDNGLLVFRLREPGSPVFHARVVLPIRPDAGPAAHEAALVVAHAMHGDVQRRLQRLLIPVSLDVRPGRIELTTHADETRHRAALEALLRAMVARPSPARLDAVRRQLRKHVGGDDAWAVLASRLTGAPLEGERIDAAALEKLTRSELTAAWSPLVDPRRAVLIVHDGQAEDAPRWLDRWTTAWRGRGRVEAEPEATARLHAAIDPPSGRERPFAEPGLPLLDAGEAAGRPAVVLGRVIPLKSAADRALARLAHRIIQEEMDARLSIQGGTALFTVRMALGNRNPTETLRRGVEHLTELATTELPTPRLRQAARLWLGARVVQASLDGEDWTGLWSQALDLSSEDAEAPAALVREAKGMLEATPKALMEFTRDWLEPAGGQPGWVWVLQGGDENDRKGLASSIPLQKVAAP